MHAWATSALLSLGFAAGSAAPAKAPLKPPVRPIELSREDKAILEALEFLLTLELLRDLDMLEGLEPDDTKGEIP